MFLEIKKSSFKHFSFKKITVYKFLIVSDDTFITPYRESYIEIGREYQSKIKRNRNSIGRALHSFVKIEDAILDSGFFYDKNIAIIECEIPAFSWYYKGIFDSLQAYASNKLKYIEVIKTIAPKSKK